MSVAKKSTKNSIVVQSTVIWFHMITTLKYDLVNYCK